MAKKRKTTMLAKLGKKMRKRGFTGTLSDYPNVKSRKDWLRSDTAQSEYGGYDEDGVWAGKPLFGMSRSNPSGEAMGGLFLAGLIGYAIGKKR